MSTRLFEDKTHASFYKKYRFSAPQEVQEIIFNYIGEKLPKPYKLALDVGCGTGQSTQILVPYFKTILGTDISQAQIEEARVACDFPNVTYSVCPAEELPVDDESVDLVTACAAIHWFNTEKFLKEVDRILKPAGCLAFYTYLLDMELHYKDESERLTKVINEVHEELAPYVNEKLSHLKSGYKDIFETIPFADKQRVEKITAKIPMSLADFMGLIQTLSMYQTYLKLEPEKAKALIFRTEQRFLEIMDMSSAETKIEVWMTNVCILASKPNKS